MYHSNILYKSNKNVCIELYQEFNEKDNYYIKFIMNLKIIIINKHLININFILGIINILFYSTKNLMKMIINIKFIMNLI